MTEIAHAAIDAGADIVVGHGPHYSLPIEVYKGKPVFYGVGNLSFHTGHRGRQHGDWLGMLVRLAVGAKGFDGVSFRFVRHNDRNESFLCEIEKEAASFVDIRNASAPLGARLVVKGNDVYVDLAE
jgi:hypothetical protein